MEVIVVDPLLVMGKKFKNEEIIDILVRWKIRDKVAAKKLKTGPYKQSKDGESNQEQPDTLVDLLLALWKQTTPDGGDSTVYRVPIRHADRDINLYHQLPV